MVSASFRTRQKPSGRCLVLLVSLGEQSAWRSSVFLTSEIARCPTAGRPVPQGSRTGPPTLRSHRWPGTATPPAALSPLANTNRRPPGSSAGAHRASAQMSRRYECILAKLLRDEQIGRFIVPMVLDEAQTFGIEAHFVVRNLLPHRAPRPSGARTLPRPVARWLPRALVVLGTDCFGRSESRQTLRSPVRGECRNNGLCDAARRGPAELGRRVGCW